MSAEHPIPSRDLVPQIVKTQYFDYLRSIATGLSPDVLANSDKTSDLARQFSGALFEWYAFTHLKATVEDASILLSPSQTLQSFHTLNPEKTLNESPFSSSIMGVSVPDGMSVQYDIYGEWCARRTYEYTLQITRDRSIVDYYERKAEEHRHRKTYEYSRFGDSDLVFVTPTADSPREKLVVAQLAELCNDYDATHVQLPTTHEIFKNTATYLWESIRTEVAQR